MPRDYSTEGDIRRAAAVTPQIGEEGSSPSFTKMQINSAVESFDRHEIFMDFYGDFTQNDLVTGIILEMSLVLDLPIHLS